MSSLKNATIDEIRQVAARICREYLTGQWKVVTPEKLTVKRISGGLSNFLYYVSLPEEEAYPAPIEPRPNGSPEYDGSNNNLIKRQRTDSEGDSLMLASPSSEGQFLPHLKLQSQQQQEPKEVLLRVYGQTHGDDALGAMITESVVFALLSERNFGPKLHGIFPGGRIEQYIPARPLSTMELSDHQISMKIAKKMGEIHSLNIPMSKEPDWLWNCMDRWLKSLDTILQGTSKCHESHLAIVRGFDYCEEAKWLKSVIDQGNYKILFCHNDLQEGNILLRRNNDNERANAIRNNFEDSAIAGMDDINALDHVDNADEAEKRKNLRSNLNNNALHDCDSTRDSALSFDCSTNAMAPAGGSATEPDLMIIDFEYCAYNYRGFDLANHFLEWTFDYSNPEYPLYYHFKQQYPNKQQRANFIATYLKKLHECVDGYEPSEEEIEAIEKEVRTFSMFSHLFWSLWSVVNTTSNIEFGYWEYAITRLQEYQAHKEEYLNGKQD